MLSESIRALYVQINTVQQQIADLETEISSKQGEINSFEIDPDTKTEQYDDMLDGVYGEFMGYSASRVLRELDPIAYRCGLNDYVDSLEVLDEQAYKDLEEELETIQDELSELEDQLTELQDELSELENDSEQD